MSLTSVGWGMIGCGDVTEVKSGPAFDRVKHSRRVAVMCRTAERAEDYAGRHHIPRWYTDPEKLLKDPEVSAIYIATPPDSHAHYSRLAARAGKAVYVEKPMARTFSQCREMIAECEKRGVPLFVAYYRRCLPKFLKVREILQTGVIGDVRTVAITLHLAPRPADLNKDSLPWRVIPEIAGGGYFMDLASHQLDLLDFLLGPIEHADGRSANQAGWYPAEDVVTATYQFKHPVLGTGSWCFTVSRENQIDRIEITGSRGTLVFSTFDAAPIRLQTPEGMREFSEAWPAHVQQPLIQAVVDALRGKGGCPSTGYSAARASRIMEEILHH